MGLQALVCCIQHRLEEARSEAMCAADIFEKLGAAKDMRDYREILQWIEEGTNNPIALYFDGELLELRHFLHLLVHHSLGMKGIG